MKFKIDMIKPMYENAVIMGVFPALDRNVLQQWITRGFIVRDVKQLEKRKGRKRLYSGLDLIKIQVIRILSWQGLALPTAARLAHLVAERCRERCAGLAKGKDENIIYFADLEGNFKFAMYHAETPESEMKTPHIYGVIASDDIIDDIAARIYGYLDNEGLV